MSFKIDDIEFLAFVIFTVNKDRRVSSVDCPAGAIKSQGTGDKLSVLEKNANQTEESLDSGQDTKPAAVTPVFSFEDSSVPPFSQQQLRHYSYPNPDMIDHIAKNFPEYFQ